MSKIADRVTELVKPVVEEQGCSLYKVSYVKEGPNYYLRVFIEKDEGVNITDCVAISQKMDAILDENESIFPNPYVFEVSSSGEERERDSNKKGV